MSVIIKDMQMPQGCFDCPFLYDTHICLHNLKEVWDKEGFDWANERLEDCPLEDADEILSINNTRVVQCRYCGHIYYNNNEKFGNDWLISYCPNCGIQNRLI